MSWQAVDWALFDAPMLLTDKGKPDSTARQVLVALASHANEQGRNAHPSVLRLAYGTGLDPRTVERALIRLQAGKLIEPCGRVMTGARRWDLPLHIVRPESEWDEMVAAAEAEKERESEARKARRHRSSSGDSEPPEMRVRDGESRTPGVSVRTSGTQSADVRDSASGIRDATPPEPSEPPVNPQANRQSTSTGGAPPPDPSRRPPPSASATDERESLSDPLTPAQDRQRKSLPREGARAPDGSGLADVIPIENFRRTA